MCGFIGLIGEKDVSRRLYTGLLTIQHRGQDSAGMITYSGRFNMKKGNGLVRDVFNEKNLSYLKGNIGIAHVRYPTVGGGGAEDAQPFYVSIPYGIILAHNGNIVNYFSLKEEMERKYYRDL
ncbi:class II glutamine amidotransferase, partial [candidate division WOR-3 bacterium]|nr:class II glutamine amidotransferase [candidate division WOR-3 bacterium]